MCRICGSFATRATGQELAAVSGRQRHGGPDAHGVARGPGWSLGCNRLAVTGPTGGGQPYRLASAPGIVAVLNGEIYNHRQLRARMAALGHAFPDDCDGTVIPALYAEHGPGFVELLDGMFAIALVDLRPDEPRLLLAVDDHGMKTLYYHAAADGGVRFASELPALLAFPQVPAEHRDEALDEYLTTRTCLGRQTALRGIRTLPPGATALATRGGGLRVHRRTPHRSSRGSLGARDALRREVRRLVQADVPVCAITSGGLDSGLVTALAAEHVNETQAPPLHTFHLTYRGEWPGSEHGFARAIARRSGTVHHQVEADPAEFADLLPRTVWHLGQPNADPITLSTYALFRAVRNEGFTVALTGDGADELFAGYDRVRTALAAPPGTGWVAPYVASLAAVPSALRESLYSSDYRAFLADRGTAEQRIAGRLSSAAGDRHAVLSSFETFQRLPAYHLRRLDHLSMAWAVEARLPFLQPSITGLAARLPVPLKTGKRALHEAAQGLLPEAVIRRPKQPFLLPVEAMLVRGTPLMALAQDVLTAGTHLDPRLSPHGLRALFTAHLRRPTGTSAMALWALVVHELWRQELRALRPAQTRASAAPVLAGAAA
ncbi:asparagine synthase (glutamine-hydrolyzing) [Streptomyces purpurogeneiscleroticus]|uniref:asparagine synthase (glutamine-hydrolyzing) n=1 Tax=Streptomyces purpurogeneiscleroticus TaxID=68259 RepID=UPI001CC14D04|nr:asparagine synthase (glutamine-hydrolyzing) [Streptomyces purpurogeneiscleroticus]MBZ4015127.1 asparagine synthase (glutamine-hydrolyzing) [Streptomyces purpurogeneiscleroticus]